MTTCICLQWGCWFSEVPRTTGRVGIHSTVSPVRHLLSSQCRGLWGVSFPPSTTYFKWLQQLCVTRPSPQALHSTHTWDLPLDLEFTLVTVSPVHTVTPLPYASFILVKMSTVFSPNWPSDSVLSLLFLSSLHSHYYFPPNYPFLLIFLPKPFSQPKSQLNKSSCSSFLFLHQSLLVRLSVANILCVCMR